jgi:DNA gyrase subunit A
VLVGSGVRDTYLTGRGSIPMRGVAHIEEVQPGKGRHRRSAVVITELPYQLSKAGWIEKLAELVNDAKLGGIADIRDESDRDGMRVVVELRRDAPIRCWPTCSAARPCRATSAPSCWLW